MRLKLACGAGHRGAVGLGHAGRDQVGGQWGGRGGRESVFRILNGCQKTGGGVVDSSRQEGCGNGAVPDRFEVSGDGRGCPERDAVSAAAFRDRRNGRFRRSRPVYTASRPPFSRATSALVTVDSLSWIRSRPLSPQTFSRLASDPFARRTSSFPLPMSARIV